MCQLVLQQEWHGFLQPPNSGETPEHAEPPLQPGPICFRGLDRKWHGAVKYVSMNDIGQTRVQIVALWRLGPADGSSDL